ncbi:MAG: hypothetical protein U1E05_21020 [Patescibacteria group bacterium]|nr:hypothetical protein [Patescibacteria group bacterium]
MNRLSTATRGIGSWRERLAAPYKQWKRGYSAFEAAVSWELAERPKSGIPRPIEKLLTSTFGESRLLLGIAEHKVALPGGRADSQNDIWCLVASTAGTISMTVEAKAREPFGRMPLSDWLNAGRSERAKRNRANRWEHIRSNLPRFPDADYLPVAYQLLHRCASAVIEARRFGSRHAACIIQSFNSPDESYSQFADFCGDVGLDVQRDEIRTSMVNEITLAIGWSDCPLATDQEIAAIA